MGKVLFVLMSLFGIGFIAIFVFQLIGYCIEYMREKFNSQEQPVIVNNVQSNEDTIKLLKRQITTLESKCRTLESIAVKTNDRLTELEKKHNVVKTKSKLKGVE